MLKQKFATLSAIVDSIDVRNGDATMAHDKKNFLQQLKGEEQDVNGKLRRLMRRWLAEAAEDAVNRTDPHRHTKYEAETAMALEKEQIVEEKHRYEFSN